MSFAILSHIFARLRYASLSCGIAGARASHTYSSARWRHSFGSGIASSSSFPHCVPSPNCSEFELWDVSHSPQGEQIGNTDDAGFAPTEHGWPWMSAMVRGGHVTVPWGSLLLGAKWPVEKVCKQICKRTTQHSMASRVWIASECSSSRAASISASFRSGSMRFHLAHSTAPTSGAAGCVKCSDLVRRLPEMLLGCFVFYSFSLSSLWSGLAADHIAYIGVPRRGESWGREGHDKAKGQCRNERFHVSSPSSLCAGLHLTGKHPADPIGGCDKLT